MTTKLFTQQTIDYINSLPPDDASRIINTVVGLDTAQQKSTSQKIIKYLRKATQPSTKQSNQTAEQQNSRFTRHQTNGDNPNYLSVEMLISLSPEKFAHMPIEVQECVIEQLIHCLSSTHVGDVQLRRSYDRLLDVMERQYA